VSEFTVVIVGAGFSGTMVAAHLLRTGGARRRVVLVEASGRLAAGMAYGTSSPSHLLNVPAGRMSAFPDNDGHFLQHLQASDPNVTGGTFAARADYGAYLRTVLDAAAEDGARFGHTLHTIFDEVTAVEVNDESRAATVTFANSPSITADRVVIAVGNLPPANPPIADRSFYASPRYIANPWAPEALTRVRPGQPVVLIGSGLTMVDIALQLSREHPSCTLHAMSRRGLLPQPHRAHGAPPSYGHFPPGLVGTAATAAGYLRAIRTHARTLESEGIDWRETMGSLRPLTARLWETLDTKQRATFLRHGRAYWDAHRHRVASSIADEFDTLRLTGKAHVFAARLLAIDETDEGARVTFRPRGKQTTEVLLAGTVINCTGPEADVRSTEHPLLRSLLERGLARADDLGLGIETDDQLGLVARNGAASPVLSLIGPQLKAQYWEATAVPELRVFAARLAKHIVSTLESQPPEARSSAIPRTVRGTPSAGAEAVRV
jgi:uncharacterized NAD(P)/FAD-binding protein YdhS